MDTTVPRTQSLDARILTHVKCEIFSTIKRSPEKAGVGGSIPSLTTMFSISYNLLKPSVCSILFQFQNQACRNLPQHKMDRTVVYLFRNGNGAALIHLTEVSDSAHAISNASD